MDTGKILTGFAFLLLSVALMVSPSSAEMQGLDCEAGSAPVALSGEPQDITLDIQEIPAFAGTGLSPKDHSGLENRP